MTDAELHQAIAQIDAELEKQKAVVYRLEGMRMAFQGQLGGAFTGVPLAWFTTMQEPAWFGTLKITRGLWRRALVREKRRAA